MSMGCGVHVLVLFVCGVGVVFGVLHNFGVFCCEVRCVLMYMLSVFVFFCSFVLCVFVNFFGVLVILEGAGEESGWRACDSVTSCENLSLWEVSG